MKTNVLQIVVLNKNSGVASLVMNLYRCIDREKVQVDFLTWISDDSIPTYADEIAACGGKVYTVPYYKKDFKGFLKQGKEVILSKPYSVVHCHEFLASLPMLYFAKQAGIPLRIAHSHNPTIEGRFKRFLVRMCQGAFRRNASVFMACSESSGEFLFGREVPVTVLKNGIEVQKYAYNAELRERLRKTFGLEEQFVVGNIGRLVPQKNQGFLLEVFREIVEQRPDSILLIIGEGSLEGKLRKKAEQLSLGNHVRFLGIQSNINELLNVMDVFVLPSVYEGLGIVLVEAQANGLPCIASDAIPQQVKMTDNFSFVSLKDPAYKWSQVILESKRNNSRVVLETIRRAGYDIEDSASQIQKLYMSLNGSI